MNKNFIKLIIPIIIVILVVFAIAAVLSMQETSEEPVAITNFQECVKAGNPIMESYPRQCAVNGQTFVEDVDVVNNMDDKIRVASPVANATISSPLTISGEARGTWFFEGDAPVVLTDWNGVIIAQGYITAQGEWMTSEFVSFVGTLTFTKPNFNNRGFLILKKDNPSGLSEFDDAIEIPIYFESVTPQTGSSNGGNSGNKPGAKDPVFCTMDAKMCPDGSYVGRQGPSCAFSPCPGN